MKKKIYSIILVFCLIISTLVGCSTKDYIECGTLDTHENSLIFGETDQVEIDNQRLNVDTLIDNALSKITDNDNTTAWLEVNNNIPFFSSEDKDNTNIFENYSNLDKLGRCGVAYANICKKLMPTEERSEIGSVKPTGWHTVKYDCVEGKYLYNRCHLIGFQLAGENANEKNLITGTRYLNIDGMLDFENEVADYVKSTENHVLYRVTPKYDGDNLVCKGLLMEAYSVEDKGAGIQFCVFVRNIQPGIAIDYKTGDSHLIGETFKTTENKVNSKGIEEQYNLILNTNTKKYHKENCSAVKNMSDESKESYNGTIEWLENNGYRPCKLCFKR